ncbi:formyltransferase [Methylobacterium trifolii]|uniref:Formyltransferase/hydrolase complex Fhc subunit B n=1 Tax=Methylobacterium trifolii TaxID=1003092 RepID=A0ABQ4TZ13_9HYPH|nr:formyltransferase [Methylobacterium trifolii]GJE60296.1 Formyltransferase/hydrolase complex Fhc subunit B [Methylobacterium trifolii]
MAAWIKGGATDADGAIAAAATLLSAAHAPVVAGLCADVAAVRAAYRLAGSIGASVDTAGAEGTYADLGSLSRVGAMTATPAEAVGRADVVLAVGARPWGAPLLKRLSETKPTRGRAAGAARSLLALGGPSGTGAALACPAEAGLPAALAHLRAYQRGHLAGDGPVADLATRLAAAQYGVVLYDPAELGEAGVEMLTGLVMGLNETTRCFALALAGPDQDRAVVQVAAWTTGQPPRVGFGRHVPEHDPWRFDAARQAAAGEVDAVLWLAALPAPRPGWLSTLPAIALVGAGSAGAEAAEIVIEVGVPGESLGGVLWNEGRAALTYRAATGPTDLPSAADVLARITHAIATGKDA